jgi:hypothetical protein
LSLKQPQLDSFVSGAKGDWRIFFFQALELDLRYYAAGYKPFWLVKMSKLSFYTRPEFGAYRLCGGFWRLWWSSIRPNHYLCAPAASDYKSQDRTEREKQCRSQPNQSPKTDVLRHCTILVTILLKDLLKHNLRRNPPLKLLTHLSF